MDMYSIEPFREANTGMNENQAILKLSLGEALMTEPPALTVSFNPQIT